MNSPPAPSALLSPWAETVRRHDPDRFLTALFAPPPKRDTLLLLYAFNHELARAREVVSEPMLALIRLQWWREVIEGERKRHELATPLSDALDLGQLDRGDLLAMLNARDLEAEPSMPDRATFLRYLDGTAGTLAVAAARLLGAEEPEQVRASGRAYGMAGQLRSVVALASQGRCQLPEDLLKAQGICIHDVIAEPHSDALRPVVTQLAAEGIGWLDGAQKRPPRAQIAAALPGVLARRDLRRPFALPGPRGLGDKLAVLAAAFGAGI